jgi:glycosyltransferase involved in cell wall biosynthesis
MSLLREEQNIVLTLMGEGSAKKNLQRISKSLGANVKLVGHYPIAVAKQAMADSDLGYVSIIPNLYKYAYPSKTVTYLENKCPILASVELNSDLARDIISSRVGIVVPQNNPKLLAEKILEYSNTEKQLRLAIKENCRTKFLNDFESVKILNGWSNLLKELFNE